MGFSLYICINPNGLIMKRLQIIVKGDNVQRCGFRNFSAQIAQKLGLTGIAEYEDHHLVIEIEGPSETIRQFIEFCKIGPEGCQISSLEIIEIPATESGVFRIIPGIVSSDIKNAG